MKESVKAWYDISPLISSRTAVFPGDVGFSRQVALDFKKGDALLLSSIQSSLHIGAHADAPNHYSAGGIGIGARGLEPYMGQCQVIQVQAAPGERIGIAHLRNQKIAARRVLFRTGSFPDPNRWNSDFNSLAPELVDTLADQGVVLIGIDTPSIDPETSKALEAHNRIAAHDLAILEGLILQDVPEGLYTLLALPLRLEDADASPVRAILLSDLTLLQG